MAPIKMNTNEGRCIFYCLKNSDENFLEAWFIWAASQENMSSGSPSSEDTDQPLHLLGVRTMKR